METPRDPHIVTRPATHTPYIGPGKRKKNINENMKKCTCSDTAYKKSMKYAEQDNAAVSEARIKICAKDVS